MLGVCRSKLDFGILVPKARLIQAGILTSPENFSTISFLGRHDRVVRAVYWGGNILPASLKRMLKPTPACPKSPTLKTFKILAKTRKIPTSPITMSQNFKSSHPRLTIRITSTITNLHKFLRGKRLSNLLVSTGLSIRNRGITGGYKSLKHSKEF